MPDKGKQKSVYKPTRTKSSVEDNYYTDSVYETKLKDILKKSPNTVKHGSTRFSKGKDERGEYVSAWDPDYYGGSFGGIFGKRDEFYTRFYTSRTNGKPGDLGPKYKTTSRLGSKSYKIDDEVDEALYNKNTIKPSGKKIPLTQGRHRGANIDEAIVNEALKASKKKGADVNDLLALMSRESTLGADKKGADKNPNMQSLVSGWNINNESYPYPFDKFLADNKVPGVTKKKTKTSLMYKVSDSASVEKHLKDNPKLVDKYEEILKKSRPMQNSFEGAIDYIQKNGVAGYNPGDPDYSNKVAKDKELVKKEKSLQDYIKKNKQKFALGGTALNTDSPAEALFEMIRATEESGFEAGNDPLVAGLKGLGGMMINSGMSMVGGGMAKSGNLEGTGGFLQDNFGTINKVVGAGSAATQTFDRGGNVNAPHIEVEGDEMFETPNGQVGEFDGPSHEQGGIPLKVKAQGVAKDGEVPGGTYIYPDSIKIGGKSLADRKKLREKRESKLQELLGDSSDKILKNTLGRVKQMNNIEDMFDRTIQHQVKGESDTPMYAEGGGIPPMVNVPPPSNRRGYGVMDMLNTFESGYEDFSGWDGTYNTGTTQEEAPGNFDMSGMPTAGDALGIFGNLYQAYKPRSLTLKNRAGDTPNINPFDNYGEDALNTLEGNIPLLGQIKDTQMQRLESNRNASVARNNNSARGVNTQRALNLATDAQMNTAEGDLMAKYAEQMLGVNGQIASTELDISGKKAQGEQYRDMSDRQDRDQFFSNLSKDEAAVGEAWSRTGKAANQIKTRGVQSKFLNEMFDYVQGDLMNGTISQKTGATGVGRNANEVIDEFKNSETYKKMSKEDKQQFNNMDALSILNMLGIFK